MLMEQIVLAVQVAAVRVVTPQLLELQILAVAAVAQVHPLAQAVLA